MLKDVGMPQCQKPQELGVGMAPARPYCVYIGKPAKLLRARVLSLSKHLAVLFQRFSTQRYPPSS